MKTSCVAWNGTVPLVQVKILPAEIKVIGMIDSKLASQNVLCMRLDRRKSQLVVFLIDVPSDRKSLEEYTRFYQLMKHRRYGILNFVDHPQVLDAYVFPFEEQEMISEHIKSLEGPGLSSEMKTQEIILLLAFLEEESCCSAQVNKGHI
uniref:Spen paralogue and orthologue SPOC C-terminal domain-containing protein n=1 Tax=Ditylenchus dipsaci TaxID=166011 RepID=A0A915DRG1_9BILA